MTEHNWTSEDEYELRRESKPFWCYLNFLDWLCISLILAVLVAVVAEGIKLLLQQGG